MGTTEKTKDMNPGDEAKAGTPGTGEAICRECRGSGRLGDRACPNCGGTGLIVEGIGGG
jgi:hypothetical protein